MAISWIVLAIGQLSAAGLPLVGGGPDSSPPASHLVAPGEPSTIVEALIGAALVAAYLVFARRFRSRRGAQPVTTPAEAGRRREAA